MEIIMIEYRDGNLLQADVEALVNTVNTVGVMGKGVALQFKQAFPDNFKAYEKAAKKKEIQPGKMFVYTTGFLTNPRYIINFPTKRHWRGNARIEDIQAGLENLQYVIQKYKIKSIAIPPLGCGFGGLEWKNVQPLIENALKDFKHLNAFIYPPISSPESEKMAIATNRPNMTKGRAALIALINLYAIPGYKLTKLEVQKLSYFLQIAGEPMRLQFEKNQYGPYAENLNFVLQRLEGHYIRGYGDRNSKTGIWILPGADEEVNTFLKNYSDTREHLERVAQLIRGFETPYGVELLATLLWLAQENPEIKKDFSLAINNFYSWNDRKKQLFRTEHIKIAWNHLKQQGWI
jgi:O-acetyl-ADP-ribose deacetylase (regulator of RNase III)